MKQSVPTRHYRYAFAAAACLVGLIGCSSSSKPVDTGKPAASAELSLPPAFHVDPATAGSISGVIRYAGPKPVAKPIDMSEDPACVEAHQGKPHDESIILSNKNGLANAFVYVKSGLEGKRFDVSATPVTIDQKGCWFIPRVLGIQTGQVLQIVNADPVTHNIHPMAMVNREWNHSQGAGDPTMSRKFTKAEVMIPVKCNIHSWMHAYIGVVDSPYFAVTKPDGTFSIGNLPPGTYTIGIWQEKLGTQERSVTVQPHANDSETFTFKGK